MFKTYVFKNHFSRTMMPNYAYAFLVRVSLYVCPNLGSLSSQTFIQYPNFLAFLILRDHFFILLLSLIWKAEGSHRTSTNQMKKIINVVEKGWNKS